MIAAPVPDWFRVLSTSLPNLAAATAPSVGSVCSHRALSSGFVWKPGLVVTADEALAEEGGVAITLPRGAAQMLTLPRGLAVALGVGLRTVRIGEVEAGGPADRGGIASGNMRIGLGDAPVAGAADLVRMLGAEVIRRALDAGVIRGRRIERRTVVPRERG